MKCRSATLEARDITWQQDAACLGLYKRTGEDLFFSPDNPGGPKAGKGIPGEQERIRRARVLCMMCPVISECLEYALDNDCCGIWGGTTEKERRKITRERR